MKCLPPSASLFPNMLGPLQVGMALLLCLPPWGHAAQDFGGLRGRRHLGAGGQGRLGVLMLCTCFGEVAGCLE